MKIPKAQWKILTANSVEKIVENAFFNMSILFYFSD